MEVGDERADIVDLRHMSFLDGRRRNGDDRGRDVLYVLGALASRDDDLFEGLALRSVNRRLRGRSALRPCRNAGELACQRAQADRRTRPATVESQDVR